MLHPAPRGQLATFVKVLAKAGLHQIVDRRICRTGIESQQRAFFLWPCNARIDPSKVAHAAKVQESHRALPPSKTGAGMVKERGQRRALSTQFHIGAAEIPDHGKVDGARQQRPVAHLQRALHPRRMGKGLAVETDKLNAGLIFQ